MTPVCDCSRTPHVAFRTIVCSPVWQWGGGKTSDLRFEGREGGRRGKAEAEEREGVRLGREEEEKQH